MVNPTVDNAVHNEILGKLVAKLREGVVPWRKVWTTGDPTRLPTNFLTRKQYHGPLNKMALWVAQQERQYPTGLWATATQWARAGGSILPDEGPEKIVRPIWSKGGFPTGYLPAEVFNLAQVQGVDVPVPEVPPTYTPGIRSEFDELVDATVALIVHGGDQAMYVYDLDVIFIPHRFRFPDYESYAQTLAHELMHWTEPRLNVLDGMQFLELRAEIGSSFLLAELGVPASDDLANHTSYIAHWLDELADDPFYLQQAAEEASRGVEFLLSFIRPGDCQKGSGKNCE
ncbi:MAG: zincin-like metallopeptidase domain-containing protein [Planctomycetota bacterium]|nr:zincin-like metallopeptidase domain-containing protein [Planctomycetota bacterium]